MSALQLLFVLFLVIPFIEIYLLIEIGSVIGSLWTIFLVVFTAMLGAWFVRQQGLSTLNRLQTSLQSQGLPAMELMEGATLLVAGALLLTPGFFTDAIGFVCLVPPLRQAIIKQLMARFLRVNPGVRQNQDGHTVNGEFRKLDD